MSSTVDYKLVSSVVGHRGRSMIIQAHKDGSHWQITRRRSIWTNRAGLEDVRICRADSWGGRGTDGRLYSPQQVLAAEDGAVLSAYGAIPAFITPEWLRDQAFLDGGLRFCAALEEWGFTRVYFTVRTPVAPTSLERLFGFGPHSRCEPLPPPNV